jgi:hypothetical protein
MKKLGIVSVLFAGMVVCYIGAAENSLGIGAEYGLSFLNSSVTSGGTLIKETDEVRAPGGTIVFRSLFGDIGLGVVTRFRVLAMTDVKYTAEKETLNNPAVTEKTSDSFTADDFDWSAIIGLGIGISKRFILPANFRVITDLGLDFNQTSLSLGDRASIYYNFGVFAGASIQYLIGQLMYIELGGEFSYDFFATSTFTPLVENQHKSVGSAITMSPCLSFGVRY